MDDATWPVTGAGLASGMQSGRGTVQHVATAVN